MAVSNSFSYKQYSRTQRLQYPEEKFNMGMQYTNTPLSEGFVKLLANYDLKDGGESLQPRAGLRVTELGCQSIDVTAPLAFSDKMSITAGKDCIEENTEGFRQVIVGEASNTKVSGTDLYAGTAHVITIDNGSADPHYLDELESKIMSFKALYGADPAFARFRRPDKAIIHNMPVSNLGYIAKQVGSFAFGNSFYYFRGSQALYRTYLNNGAYDVEAVPIKTISPKEAVLWGYNMLKANPYVFTDTEVAGVIQLLGLLPYDDSDNLIMSPQVNQTIKFRCYYAGVKANKYKVYWDWKEPGAASWTTFKTADHDLALLPALTAELSPPNKEIMVRVTAYKYNGAVLDTVAEKVLTVGFNFDKEAYGSTANISVQNYDLSTCNGMTFWKNRLVLYGVPKDPTILWFSDINDPGYFPYPNSVDTFDEPIISVTPILDSLLVFTETKLHLLTLNTDGLTWTKKTIQGNLDIKDWDIHLIQVVKNMVFFKSGNYYYMVVPKATSSTGELTIAPISKYIESFLDEFDSIVPELMSIIYDYKGTLSLVHYYNYLDFEDVHNVYVFQTSDNVYINVDLLYNTVLRMWRLHFYESQAILQPYKQDATKKGTLVSLVKLLQRFKTSPTTTQLIDAAGLQFYQFNNIVVSDLYIPLGIHLVEEMTVDGVHTPADIEDLTTKFEEVHKFLNYQFVDLGYREHGTDYNKRYREIQIKFNNISQKTLQFLTEFSIDGDMRKSFYQYEAHQETDPENPNYGLLYLERLPVIQEELPGSTILAEEETSGPNEVYTVIRDLDPSSPTYGIINISGDVVPDADLGSWTLDSSRFPETVLWKVRIPVSGKGYAPKMRLLSLNEERYELLNVSWVLRMMNSR